MRELDSDLETTIPNATSTTPRWVKFGTDSDENLLSLGITIEGIEQIATYDANTNQITQLTFTAGQKGNPFIWHAPEYTNELLAMSLLQSQAVVVYRNSNGRWQEIRRIIPPADKPYIHSAEPFIYNGKSYISYVSTDLPSEGGALGLGDVWISGINATNPFDRRISDPAPAVRRNPHTFITTRGPFVYYTLVPTLGPRNIYRAATGLKYFPPAP